MATMSSALSSKVPFSAIPTQGNHLKLSPVRLKNCFRVPSFSYFLQNEVKKKDLLKSQGICSTTNNGDASDISDSYKSSADQEDTSSRKSNGNKEPKPFTFNEFYVAPAPGKLGYLAAAERFLKIMAMVWAGSQVTKLVRLGGAVALAPFVDKGLSWFTTKFKFQTQGKAFMAIVGCCFTLALLLFFMVISA
ncbi:hypothetical protein MKW94_024934 [Papaver nudicaule]|uniref:Uncharacterized protein n=1 Tax=Papaver nudicaule TaxID=74823 RepID=A0AA41VH24_PAPNU|nr:hypothetical protein [Papaver nudicaule]